MDWVIRNAINMAMPPRLDICLLLRPFNTGFALPYRFFLAARCMMLGILRKLIRKLDINTNIYEYMFIGAFGCVS